MTRTRDPGALECVVPRWALVDAPVGVVRLAAPVAFAVSGLLGLLPWSSGAVHVAAVLGFALLTAACAVLEVWAPHTRHRGTVHGTACLVAVLLLLLSPLYAPGPLERWTIVSNTTCVAAEGEAGQGMPVLGDPRWVEGTRPSVLGSWTTGRSSATDALSYADTSRRAALLVTTLLLVLSFGARTPPLFLLPAVGAAVLVVGAFALRNRATVEGLTCMALWCVFGVVSGLLRCSRRQASVTPAPSPPLSVEADVLLSPTPQDSPLATGRCLSRCPSAASPAGPSDSPLPAVPVDPIPALDSGVASLALDAAGVVVACTQPLLDRLQLPEAAVVHRSLPSLLDSLRVESPGEVGPVLGPSDGPPEAAQVFIRTAGLPDGSGRTAAIMDVVPVGLHRVVALPTAHAAVEHLPLPCCVLSLSGAVLCWNKALAALVGRGAWESLGTNAFDFLFGDAAVPVRSFPFVGTFALEPETEAHAGRRWFTFALWEWPLAAGTSLLCSVQRQWRPPPDREVLVSVLRPHIVELNASVEEDSARACKAFARNVIAKLSQLERLQDNAHRDPTTTSADPTDFSSPGTPRSPNEGQPDDASDHELPDSAVCRLRSLDHDVARTCVVEAPLGREFLVGRSGQCHLTLHDNFVSAVQFTLQRGRGREPTITDRSSLGTYINLRPCDKRGAVLAHGDHVTFRTGNASFFKGFRVELPGQERPAPPKRSRHTTTIKWRESRVVLGKGGNAQVVLGINCTNGMLLAVKQVAKGRWGAGEREDRKKIEALKAEITFLSKAEHENIVKYYGLSESGAQVSILLEFVSGGSIRRQLDEFGPLEETLVLQYLEHALRGLAYLHDRSIVHADLKCANMLVTDRGVVKLSDFGTAAVYGEQPTERTAHGTLLWCAPERWRGESSSCGPATLEADVWSLGCCVVEMLGGSCPWGEYDFQGTQDIINVLRYAEEPPEIPTVTDPLLHSIVHSCLVFDPARRPTVRRLLAQVEQRRRGPAKPQAAKQKSAAKDFWSGVETAAQLLS